MKCIMTILLLSVVSFTLSAQENDPILQQQMLLLRQQTNALQAQVDQLQHNVSHKKKQEKKENTVSYPVTKPKPPRKKTVASAESVVPSMPEMLTPKPQKPPEKFHSASVSVNTSVDADPESVDFYPTALVADNHVLTYIAGTPVISSPYLGSRPAFDGSDYIVNISSINRDIRLMQQRRSLERAYAKMGYPLPERPILALSGAVVPIGSIGQPYFGRTRADWNLGSDELDLAAIVNSRVEAYMALAYNAKPPPGGGPRVTNSSLRLNMGFANIGNLDESPFYLTAGQLFAPFGRFSTSMISATLPMMMGRIQTRPFILGYKSQTDSGPYAALYGFRSETTLGSTGAGGINLGYIVDAFHATTEVGASLVTALNDSGGMQTTGSPVGTTFGGFGSFTNGNEDVHKIPGLDVHVTMSFDRYNITTEWLTSVKPFNTNELSFDGKGAQPQALQLEGGVTFISFTRPSSLALAWQWSSQALALNIPRQRINTTYNISIWKDTVESIEYRHDIDYGPNHYANGATPESGTPNENTLGSGGSADTVLLQIGIYF
ncbi:MAG: LbtU family siderophore porin [Gammaproteobacteria bacterium]|nr:LbtU family siderophore porin [Gammaproteobacteria bacterium]